MGKGANQACFARWDEDQAEEVDKKIHIDVEKLTEIV